MTILPLSRASYAPHASKSETNTLILAHILDSEVPQSPNGGALLASLPLSCRPYAPCSCCNATQEAQRETHSRSQPGSHASHAPPSGLPPPPSLNPGAMSIKRTKQRTFGGRDREGEESSPFGQKPVEVVKEWAEYMQGKT